MKKEINPKTNRVMDIELEIFLNLFILSDGQIIKMKKKGRFLSPLQSQNLFLFS